MRIGRAASEARGQFGDSGALGVHVLCDVDEFAAATNRTPDDVRQGLAERHFAYILRSDIWLYGPSYEAVPLLDQQRIIYHEYFHSVQHFLSGNRSARSDVNRPAWLIEGSARYFENAVLPRDLDAFQRRQVRRWESLPALVDLEQSTGSSATGATSEVYTVGSVASDYLVKTYGRERLQSEFWVAFSTTDWRSAFLQVFGATVDSFYADFEAYRSTLRP